METTPAGIIVSQTQREMCSSPKLLVFKNRSVPDFFFFIEKCRKYLSKQTVCNPQLNFISTARNTRHDADLICAHMRDELRFSDCP